MPGDSCFDFLRCLLCCQYEVDDCFYIDCGTNGRNNGTHSQISDSNNTSVPISSSSPDYSYQAQSNYRSSYFRNSEYQEFEDSRTPLLYALYKSQHSSVSKPPQASKSSSSVHQIPKSSTNPPQSSTRLPQSSSFVHQSPTSTTKTSQSSTRLPQSSYSVHQFPTSSTKTAQSTPSSSSLNHSNPFASSSKPTQSLVKVSQYASFGPSSPSGSKSSLEKLPQTLKPTLIATFTNLTNPRGKATYTLDEDDSLPLYLIPEDFKDLIKRDVVPKVLKKPLSPSIYKEYFSVLLYAEDYYYEKWSDCKLENVTLKLHEATINKKADKRKSINGSKEKDDKILVEFKIDAFPERRPFLLSRDLVHARPVGSQVEPFQGIIYRVVKSDLVLVEFKDDFHSQYNPCHRYNISFSFNRVCLKRAHQALNAVSDSLFQNFLFPNNVSRKSSPHMLALNSDIHKLDEEIISTSRQIANIQGSPPFLVVGPRCASEMKAASHLRIPSRTGVVIQASVIQIYKTSPDCRILICAPSNSACDVLMRGLKKVIPESDMFRANAAFREKDDVPDDIISSCLFKKECFSCPPLQNLRKLKVILSTFISCFRLHNVGLPVGHFSHIFMVDTSDAIEPEAMVPLANFADENTSVIVTGEVGFSPSWVRSEIARKNGLKISYFERLRKSRRYQNLSPSYITQLD
ncbi:hypothetical protein UlMin_010817 [Ulmus minor]